MKTRKLLTLAALVFVLAACGKGQTEIEPPEIRYGETECLECRMIISDPRFAAGYTHAVNENRYESMPFDDIGDMLTYAAKHPVHDITAPWVHDYATEEWIDVQSAYYVFSHDLETPMAQGTAAVDSREKAEQLAAEVRGEVLDWPGLLAKHSAGQLVTSAIDDTTMSGHDTKMHQMSADHALVTLGETDASGYHMALLAHGPLHAGYNHLMLQITDPDGETVTQAEVTFHPLMHMPDMTHAAPIEQPGAQAHLDGHFGGAVGFPMPSGPDLGDWELGVAFADPDRGQQGEATFPIQVAPSRLSASFVAADDEGKLFLMVISPQEAAVGLQDFEVLAVEKQSAMAWPAVDDLSLEMIPEMPTMGHGSSDNENPVHVSQGHYRGKVNFSMAGPWTVTVKVSRDGAEIGTVVFEYDLE